MVKKNKKNEIEYLRQINEERKTINKKLNDTLTNLIEKGEKLENYEIWVNTNCDIFIQPVFIITKIAKDLKKEGFNADTAYVIMKKESEAGEIKK